MGERGRIAHFLCTDTDKIGEGSDEGAEVGGLLAIQGTSRLGCCQGPTAGGQSVLMSVAHVATKSHKNAQILDCHLWPCWDLRDVC